MRTRHLLSQTAIYMIGLGASRGISILLVPLYTRQLTEAEFFTWDLATTTALFILSVAELGMSSALARFYVKADAADEKRSVAQTASWVLAFAVPLCALLVIALRDTASRLVFDSTSAADLIILISLTTTLTAFSNLPLALLRAQGRPTAYAAICLLRALVAPAMIILLVVKYGFGVKGILLGDAAGLAAMGIAGYALSPRDLLPRFHRAALRDLLSFGVPLVPIGIANAIILVSDRYFLREFVDPVSAATYSLGFKIALLVNLVTMALQTAWAPTAFQIAKLDDAPRKLADLFRLLAAGLGALALVTSLAAPELARVFAPGGAYAGADRIVPWIAFSYALQSAVLIMNTNLVIANRTAYSAVVYCAGAAAKLLLNFLLIQRYGIHGAAIATLGAFAFQLIVTYFVGNRIYPVPYDLPRLAALCALLALTTWAAFNTLGAAPLVSIAARAAFFLLFLLALPLCRVVKTSEIPVATILNRVRGR